MAGEMHSRTELLVGTVNVVENAQHTKALIEFQVVEIMGFRRWQSGEVIATVGIECR